ncbi:MAG TPA: efflux RND transporter periplasmic adaptor subunit [Haliangiales bacterium]|nr:efflux RND transporter periplasmic adaptor subunit [Haliangiales bacterium]
MDGDRLSSDLASLKIDRDAPPRRSIVKPLIWLAILGGLVAAAYFLLLPRLSAQIFKTEVDITEMAMVSPAHSSVQLAATGYVVAETTAKVGAKAMGRIVELPVKDGTVVKKGDLIARLDDQVQRGAVATARAKVAAARARAQAARASLAETQQQIVREKLLVERGVSGQAVVDDLQLKARTLAEQQRAADAEVGSAQTEVDALEVTLRDMTITAPIDGTVTERFTKLGEMMSPTTVGGVNIVELVDFNSLVVEVDVSEAKLYLIREESPCEASLDAFPGKRYRCATYQLGKKVDRSKATVKVKVKFVDAADGALPDMSAKVNFLEKELDASAVKEPAKLIVPGAAVAERGGAKVVFVVSEGKVKMVPIEVGAAFGDGFVVKQGPGAGTKVVANPPADLADGASVKEKRS